jgi:hypothetical protein
LRKGAKEIYTSLVLINYSNEKQYAAGYIFGSNRQVIVGF